MWWELTLCVAIGYAFGSVPVGLIVGRIARGIDIREFGSGKTGFTNVLRTVGARWGVAALAGDLAKGAAPVLIAFLVSDSVWVHAAAGLAAAIGHDWPVFAGFRGGRGVAASYGVTLALNPLASLALLPVAIGVLAATRIMSLLSVGMAPVLAGVFVVLAAFDMTPWAYAGYAVVAAIMIVVLHRDNIQRLIAGTEPRIGESGDRRADDPGAEEPSGAAAADRPGCGRAGRPGHGEPGLTDGEET